MFTRYEAEFQIEYGNYNGNFKTFNTVLNSNSGDGNFIVFKVAKGVAMPDVKRRKE
jgi:hypothetical protein